MALYKVLWIDDEPEKQEAFFEFAELNDIVLTNFKTSRTGIIELEKRINFYDAVILDAKVFNESEDEVAKLTGLHNSIKEINRLSAIRVIPYFVFSGQPDVIDNEAIQELLGDLKIYRKGSDNDALLSDVKEAADKQIETQIRHDHKKVFDAVEGFDPEVSKTLLKILIAIKTGDNNFDDQQQFTQIRIILEWLFRNANKFGLLHDNCLPKGQVNLTDSSLFLSGMDTKHCGVRSSIRHFPKLIADAVKNILFITGGASHTTEIDATVVANIQEYRKTINTPYLLFNLTFQLMDIIIWFHNYSALNSNVDDNRKHWEYINSDEAKTGDIVGKISVDEEGNYYSGDAVFQRGKIHEIYKVGDEVIITKQIPNTNFRTKNMYTNFIVGFKIK